MLTRLLLASALATLAVSGVDARLRATDIDLDDADFSVQGLEQLESRYGSAFPGYAGANVQQLGSSVLPAQQQLLGLSAAEQQSLLAGSGMYQDMAQQSHSLGMQNVNMRLGVGAQVPSSLGWQQSAQAPRSLGWQQTAALQQQQVPQNWAQQYGDIGIDSFSDIGIGAVPQWSNIGVQQQLGSIGVQQQQQPIIGQQLLGNVGLQQRMQQPQINLAMSNVDMVNLQQPVSLSQIPQIERVQQQQQFGLGMSNVDMVNLQQPVSLSQIPQIERVQQSAVSSVMPNYQAPLLGSVGVGVQIAPQQQWQQTQQTFGGIGAFGAAPAGGASKKTTTAQAIYAQPMVVPKIITQPIYRPHSVTQPIVQQQLIQQPIVETRQVIQPVIRRIITQPIIRPEIYESTTIQPTLKTETVVQPHIVQQTVVTPQLQNEYSEQAPIQEKPKTKVQPAQVQAVQSQKKSAGAGGLGLGAF